MKHVSLFSAAFAGLVILTACASEVTVGSGSGALGGLGEPTKSDGTCNARLSACSGTCVELTGDDNNCGSCGTKCANGDSCQSGVCTAPPPPPPPATTDAGTDSATPTCNSGSELCGGQCIDVLFDDANCGRCNNACTGGKKCTRGICM